MFDALPAGHHQHRYVRQPGPHRQWLSSLKKPCVKRWQPRLQNSRHCITSQTRIAIMMPAQHQHRKATSQSLLLHQQVVDQVHVGKIVEARIGFQRRRLRSLARHVRANVCANQTDRLLLRAGLRHARPPSLRRRHHEASAGKITRRAMVGEMRKAAGAIGCATRRQNATATGEHGRTAVEDRPWTARADARHGCCSCRGRRSSSCIRPRAFAEGSVAIGRWPHASDHGRSIAATCAAATS
mmetsp:Transcript_32949/g.98120  ORF Transcript_32949/g.98120 Transcript_32949/m.98120 type:complete len:241 (+) Transcript_32949:87-809(+)